jgi:hypothetical protein
MKDERVPKKAVKGYTEGITPVRRPRGRWIEAVDKNVKSTSKCKIWRKLADDRDAWRRKIEEAKAQAGLYRPWKKKSRTI